MHRVGVDACPSPVQGVHQEQVWGGLQGVCQTTVQQNLLHLLPLTHWSHGGSQNGIHLLSNLRRDGCHVKECKVDGSFLTQRALSSFKLAVYKSIDLQISRSSNSQTAYIQPMWLDMVAWHEMNAHVLHKT